MTQEYIDKIMAKIDDIELQTMKLIDERDFYKKLSEDYKAVCDEYHQNLQDLIGKYRPSFQSGFQDFTEQRGQYEK